MKWKKIIIASLLVVLIEVELFLIPVFLWNLPIKSEWYVLIGMFWYLVLGIGAYNLVKLLTYLGQEEMFVKETRKTEQVKKE